MIHAIIYQTMDARRLRSLLKSLTAPAAVILAVSLVLIMFNLVLVYHNRSYNSDDVSWQNILLTWRPFSGHKAFLGGSDNFIIKAPLFALFGHFFAPSRRLLLLESGVFASAAFMLFYGSSLYFLKKLKVRLTYVNLLPFLWFASFGFFTARLYLNPILRNFELGLAFVAFVLAAKIYYGEINVWGSLLAKVTTLLSCAIAGLLIYNDPYFLYFTLVPVVVLFILLYVLKKLERAKLLALLGIAVASLLFSKLIAHLAIKAGVVLLFKEPAKFVSFDALSSNVTLAAQGTLNLFGANFFGQLAASLVAVSALLNFGILAFIFYRIWILKRAGWSAKGELSPYLLWSGFFGCLSLFVLAVYTFSSLAVDIGTYRYLIMMAFSSVLFLAIVISSLKKGRLVLAGVITAAILFNLAAAINGSRSSLGDQAGALINKPNSLNFQIIDALGAKGLTKGYAPYWDGNINSYLSGGHIAFLPISCFEGQKTEIIQFLIDQSQVSRPASRSFYVIDPDLSSPATCTQQQVVAQFGQPAEKFKLSDKTIWLYNYDIVSKM